jgi:hypothetical protein
LRKAQVMCIRGSPTANQTRLLGHVSNVLAITNPTRLRQRQHALIDCTGSALLFASIRTTLCLRTFCFFRYLGSVCGIGREHCDLCSESLLNARGICCGETVFDAENPMSPICGLLGRVNLPSVRPQVVRAAQPMLRGRGLVWSELSQLSHCDRLGPRHLGSIAQAKIVFHRSTGHMSNRVIEMRKPMPPFVSGPNLMSATSFGIAMIIS